MYVNIYILSMISNDIAQVLFMYNIPSTVNREKSVYQCKSRLSKVFLNIVPIDWSDDQNIFFKVTED